MYFVLQYTGILKPFQVFLMKYYVSYIIDISSDNKEYPNFNESWGEPTIGPNIGPTVGPFSEAFRWKWTWAQCCEYL